MKSYLLRRWLFAFVLIALGLLPARTQAQTPSHSNAKDTTKYRLHPTPLQTSPTKVYVPKDLPDAFTELDKMLSPTLTAEMRKGSEKAMWQYHMGLGMWMRNNWGLWKGLRLAKWFNHLGISVPDDMSGIILVSYWRHLHHKPIGLQAQIKEYQEYWKQAASAQAREKRRVVKAKVTIRAMMINLTVVGDAKQTLTFPPRELDSVRVRYMAPYAGGILLTMKTFTSPPASKRPSPTDFSTQCYFLDLITMGLHPIQLPEMEQVVEGMVINDRVYFHGVRQGRDVLLELSGNKRAVLPMPNGKGLLRLGMEQPGTAKCRLLVIRPHTVARWNGQWETLYQAKDALPCCALPTQQIGARLYFRDEGYYEDDKRLSWLEKSAPGARVFFDDDIGLVGSEGPRWENVWSYAETKDGALWLTAGSITGSQTLLKWTRRAGYQVALFNDATTFNGEFFGASSREDTAAHVLAITGIEAQSDGSVYVIGPHGLFQISGHRLFPLLRFTKAPYDWLPTHLLTLDAHTFLAGGHFGGVYLFRKGADGAFQVFALGENRGAPMKL